MQSRRDQVQAQSYVLGRLNSALIAADPDSSESPNRRTLAGIVAGLLVAALVVAGFAVYGFLVPGAASKWRRPGVLIVERETGSRYLLSDGRLRPVLNYASARLLLGAKPEVVSVSAASLRGVPHGQPVGIVGAPDVLPAASALRGTVWFVCASTTWDAAGTARTATTLTIAGADDGPGPADPASPAWPAAASGSPATRWSVAWSVAWSAAAPLPADRAIMVRPVTDAVPEDHLLWHGRRFRLAAPWLAKIFGSAGGGVPVRANWLDLLPAGRDITPVPVPGRGEAGPDVDGQPSQVGQLFVAQVDGAAARYYQLRRDGLSQLTATGYAIASADPEAVGQPRQISLAAVAQLPVSGQPAPGAGLPATLPTLVQPGPGAGAVGGGDTTDGGAGSDDGAAWCVRTPTGGSPALVAGRPADRDGAAQTGLGVTRTGRTADVVDVAAGVGGLVVAGRPGQAAGSSYYLITDAGLKYPLAGADVARTLGYPTQDAAVVPPGLLDLLPTGPLIDPDGVGGDPARR